MGSDLNGLKILSLEGGGMPGKWKIEWPQPVSILTKKEHMHINRNEMMFDSAAFKAVYEGVWQK